MANLQDLILTIDGLYTSPNPYSAVPKGALAAADNFVFYAPSLGESRRGQNFYGTVLPDPPKKLFIYDDNLIVNYDDKLAYDAGDGDWTEYGGSFDAPEAGRKIVSLESNKNFYFTSANGIYKLDGLTVDPFQAGAPKGLDSSGTLTGSGGWFTPDNQVAMRVVWGYKDLNGNLIIGAPSQRYIITNPSGSGTTYNVTWTFAIPYQVELGWFYQVYKSNLSGDEDIVPSDDLFLSLEGNPTAGQLTAGEVSVLDTTPYGLTGAALYTNAGQEGAGAENDLPPYCKDFALFRNHVFYANTMQRSSVEITLLGVGVNSATFGYYTGAVATTTNASAIVGGLSTTNIRVGMRVIGTGIQTDSRVLSIDSGTQITMTKTATATSGPTVSLEFQDRLTIYDVDYWGGSAADLATNTFEVANSGSVSADIADTALSLIYTVNRSASNTVIYAYSLSGIDDLPGVMLFQARELDFGEFLVTSTDGNSFTPVIPESSAITVISVASPTQVTSTGHGLVTGDVITIWDSNSTPSIDGEWTVTVINANAFTIPIAVTIAGTAGKWVPTIELVASDDMAEPNAVYVSKPNQPEAVPFAQKFYIGSANFQIQRVFPLRDSLFFIKQDGTFTITGYDMSSFQVVALDTTVNLLCLESVAALQNNIFCYTDQAISVINDTGSTPSSIPIERQLLRLSTLSNFAENSFGVSYESDRIYAFFTVTDSTDTYATQAFIYNGLGKCWSRWIMPRTCGIVTRLGGSRLYMGSPDGFVYEERKDYSRLDYADESYAVTIASVSGDVVTLSDASDAVVGMTLKQDTSEALVDSIAGNDLTMSSAQAFAAGAAELYTPIDVNVRWNKLAAANPGIQKQFSEVTFIFEDAAFEEATAQFSTNFAATVGTQLLPGNYQGSWGEFGWGELEWGGYSGGDSVIRAWVPNDYQRCTWLNVSLTVAQAFNSFKLAGLSTQYSVMSSRIR